MSHELDAEDCRLACGGDRDALERLVRRHQRRLFNLAVRLVLSPVEAEDLTQEALIRIITKLSTFRAEARFSTWSHRILVNCFIDRKRGKMEQAIVGFERYGEELDALVDDDANPEAQVVVQEAQVGCMLGMLLCLDREQRLVYVLGEIFETPSDVAAEILDVSAATFRKRLERARRDLRQFMDAKCGLVRRSNPCRCRNKTKAFIEAGWVEPDNRRFVKEHVARLQVIADDAPQSFAAAEAAYAELFRRHPQLDGPDLAGQLQDILQSNGLQDSFLLN